MLQPPARPRPPPVLSSWIKQAQWSVETRPSHNWLFDTWRNSAECVCVCVFLPHVNTIANSLKRWPWDKGKGFNRWHVSAEKRIYTNKLYASHGIHHNTHMQKKRQKENRKQLVNKIFVISLRKRPVHKLPHHSETPALTIDMKGLLNVIFMMSWKALRNRELPSQWIQTAYWPNNLWQLCITLPLCWWAVDSAV